MSNKKNMKIISKEFRHGEYIPKKFTCNGENINPELEFVDIPKEAKSLVLIMDDPDVPIEARIDRNFDHWILYNIPNNVNKILEKEKKIGITGKNTLGKTEYRGPCPPDTIHRYFFRLYALNSMLEIRENIEKEELYKIMENKIIAKTVLIGLYEQPDEFKKIELR